MGYQYKHQKPAAGRNDNLMSKHASKPYNPLIANAYYPAGFIESWGRGIEKICQTCEEDGYPRSEYMVNPEDIMIKFTVHLQSAYPLSFPKGYCAGDWVAKTFRYSRRSPRIHICGFYEKIEEWFSWSACSISAGDPSSIFRVPYIAHQHHTYRSAHGTFNGWRALTDRQRLNHKNHLRNRVSFLSSLFTILCTFSVSASVKKGNIVEIQSYCSDLSHPFLQKCQKIVFITSVYR